MERENEMDDEREQRTVSGKITVDATPEMRRGVFANLVMAITLPTGMVQLNFIDADRLSDSGEAEGVLAARVYMAPPDVVALRDMLIKHTESWKVEGDGAEA